MTENDLRHWLLVIAADRPNVFGEMGIRSELRHNPAGLVRKTLIATAIVAGVVVLMTRRKRG